MQNSLSTEIEKYAKQIGFDLVGFSPAKIEEKYLKAFESWLKNGLHADMHYMEKIAQRRDLTQILPDAKSVIVLAVNYYREQKPLQKNHGRVARYAYGRDYHKIIGKKLKNLEKFIREITPKFFPGKTVATKSYVDTGPILERALAEQAGIGRIGKNTCLITPEFGSWVFLSEIITNLDLTLNFSQLLPRATTISTAWSNSKAKSFNVCGGCNRCVAACPTGAIIAPGVIDARLCISYLTIENRGKIPPKLAKIIKEQQLLYGCDICQEVCPHNIKRQQPIIANANIELANPPIATDQLNLTKIANIKSNNQFLQHFAGSPLTRAKVEGLKRNAKVLQKSYPV